MAKTLESTLRAQKTYRGRQVDERGLTQVKVWVPTSMAARLKQIAKDLRNQLDPD